MNEEKALRSFKARLKRIHSKTLKTITDGFGTYWSAVCPVCGKESMVIIRPGVARCEECGWGD